ncbi:MAG: hypothetical protein LBG57_14750 [Treponema sp.]|jgi:hypothetical protein|nr:hypothetical protein [Treponema sp.]
MKNTKVLFGFAAFVAAAVVVLTGCWSSAPAQSSSAPVVQQPAAPPPSPKNPYFDRDGGKGMSLAILAPQGRGLAADQDYLPALVQGEFVSNFSGYSAISVLDRVQLDNQYAELLSGYYEDDAEAGMDLGRLTPTEYIMGGSITKTTLGYALQIQITKSSDKMTAASYSGTCTFAELDNLSGIRRVSLDLLQKMGIGLTDRAKTELAGAAAVNHVNAQTALAQGITAQQGGDTLQSLVYYYDAVAFDTSLVEAANRLSILSATVTSGNISQRARNLIEQKREWEKILGEAEEYFADHPYFDLVYDPAIHEGAVNYQNETIELRINYGLAPNSNLKVIQDLQKGLLASGHSAEWGLSDEPGYRNRNRGNRSVERYIGDESVPKHVWPGTSNNKHYWVRKNFVYTGIAVVFHLINEKGKTIAAFNTGVKKIYLVNDIIWNNHDISWENADYDVGYGRILPGLRPQGLAVFNPKIDDITDGLTIQVAAVLGKNNIGYVYMLYFEFELSSASARNQGADGNDTDITGNIRIFTR